MGNLGNLDVAAQQALAVTLSVAVSSAIRSSSRRPGGAHPRQGRMGLRAARDDGGPLRFRHALVRGLLGVFVEKPGISLGLVAIICSPRPRAESGWAICSPERSCCRSAFRHRAPTSRRCRRRSRAGPPRLICRASTTRSPCNAANSSAGPGSCRTPPASGSATRWWPGAVRRHACAAAGNAGLGVPHRGAQSAAAGRKSAFTARRHLPAGRSRGASGGRRADKRRRNRPHPARAGHSRRRPEKCPEIARKKRPAADSPSGSGYSRVEGHYPPGPTAFGTVERPPLGCFARNGAPTKVASCFPPTPASGGSEAAARGFDL